MLQIVLQILAIIGIVLLCLLGIILLIIGLVLFELLFEARARYIYTYVPVFCVLAALGMNGVVQKITMYLNYKKRSKEFDFY